MSSGRVTAGGTRQSGTRPEAPAGGVDVDVRDVHKTYGQVTALRGASMHVDAAAFVGITGPSGSGKSTLLGLIGSLDSPDSGTITVGGEPVPLPRHALAFRRHVAGFVFQDNLLLPYLSARDNIAAALLAAGVGRGERRRRADELLAEVDMSHRAEHIPAELSGGQRQAVAIARALANDPRLLLADEPTGALDSRSGRRVLDLLTGLRDRHGMTLIVVSHDGAVAERTDRIVHLIDGRVAED